MGVGFPGVSTSTDRELALVGIAVLTVVLAAVALFINVGSFDMTMGIVTALVLLVVSIPMFRRLADADKEPGLFWLLAVALVVKFAGSLGRYWMVTRLYGGGGDSVRYTNDGWTFAQAVRSGSIIPHIESIDAAADGTSFLIKLTGYLFVFTGKSMFAGYFFFSWLAFLGCLMFARGMKRAFPESNHRLYMYLVLFWPSLVFWPSSIGKDAFMVFCLGIVTYGACVVLAPKPQVWGIAPFALGLFGLLQVRPHVALMAVLAVTVATGFAFLGGTKAEQAVGRGRTVRLGGLVVMVLLALTASTQTTRFFTDEAGQALSTTEAFAMTQKRTQQGGSEFQPVIVSSPVTIPAATISVLFRPFPWEVNSAGMAISSLEGLAVLGLLAFSWKRLARWPVSSWRRPILLFGFVYTLMFVVAFASIGNAGILARQRSQMLPLLFMALAVPATKWWRKEDDSDTLSDPAAAFGADEEADLSDESQELLSR